MRENVKAASKRLETAEEALSIGQEPAPSETVGLDVTEIVEELDGAGNITASSLHSPDQAAPKILEALQERVPKDRKEKRNATANGHLLNARPETSFSHGKDVVLSGKSASLHSAHMRNIESHSLGTGPMNQRSNAPGMSPNMASGPSSKGPDEGKLRQEMLEYVNSVGEVGAIVAEMDLDPAINDGASDSEVYVDDGDSVVETSEDEMFEEDEFGRATGKLIDDDYRNHMLELEQKHNAKAIINVGPKDSSGNLENSVVQAAPSQNQEKKAEKKGKKSTKGVRFAEKLDIREVPSTKKMTPMQDDPEDPLSSSIVEHVFHEPPVQHRSFTRNEDAASGAQNRNPRSNSIDAKTRKTGSTNILNGPLARISEPTTLALPTQFHGKSLAAPQGSLETKRPKQLPKNLEGKVHGNIVEQPMQETGQDVAEPDEYDPALIQQQVAIDLRRHRNKSIYQSGGFTQHSDHHEKPIDDKGRKVSRFKAARVMNPIA